MMLKVTVDLHPGGISEFRRTLAIMTVSNVTGLSDVSDYEITATEETNVLAGTPARIFWFRLRGHDRRQSVWKLIASAIGKLDEAESAEL